MEWEDTKENFVPVKHGHSAAALSTPLAGAKRGRDIEDAKRAFLEDIKAADDPLAAWQRYIKWTQEQCAAQGGKAELQQVLETATKSLSTTTRYNNDVRLLRIWVQYADCLPDPSDVFLYLENHGICRDHALLYEAYATYLELKGNFQQAGLVYQEGINRLAKPLDRLKQKHAAFQQRMEKRLQRQSNEALLGMDTAAADTSTARTTLAPVVPPQGPPQRDENGNPIRPSRQQPQQRQSRPPMQAGSVAAGIRPATSSSTRPSLFGGSSSAAPPAAGGLFGMAPAPSSRSIAPAAAPMAPASTAAAAANGAKLFDVLVDDEFGPSGSGSRPTAFPSGHGLHGQLPEYKAGRKENTTEAAIWAGQKLKQQPVYTAPTANKLEVYEDDDDFAEEGTAAAPAEQQSQQHGNFRQQLEASGTQAAHSSAQPAAPAAGGGLLSTVQPLLQQQPRSVVTDDASKPAASSTSVTSKSGAGSNAAAPVSAVAAPQGYDAALLVGPDGSELSFEEVRAAAWRTKHATELQQEQEQRKQLEEQQQHAEERQRQELLAKQCAQQQLEEQQRQQQLLKQRQLEEQQRQERLAQQQERQRQELLAQQQELERQKQLQAQQAREEAAAAEAAAAARAQQEKLWLQQQQQHHTATEPTVTVNTRAALDSMNFMFSQDLPTMTLSRGALASASAGQGSAAAGGQSSKQLGGMAAEPTVTVNTRAALDAMNGMFGCGDDTTTMHGFGAPRGGMGRSNRGVPAEPTVTINTRQAFDYMNDVFWDMTAQQTMTERQMMAARGTQKGGSSRLSMAGPAGAAGSGWQLHEDTELLQNTRNLAGNKRGGGLGTSSAAGAWELREDTEFVGEANRSGAGGPSTGLDLCEDTEFITRPVGGAAPGSQFSLYEDTDYLNVPLAQATGGLNRLSLANRSSGSGQMREPQGSGGLGLGLHEDTDLITGHMGAGAAAVVRGLGGASRAQPAAVNSSRDAENMPAGGLGLGLHEDTDFLTSSNVAMAGSRGIPQSARLGSNRPAATAGLGLHEDTDLLTSSTAARAAGFSKAGSSRAQSATTCSGNAEHQAIGLGLHEDTELLTSNIAAAPAGFGRAGGTKPHAASSMDPENAPVPAMGLSLHEDTELLSGPAAPQPMHASFARGGSSSSTRMPDECSDTTTGLLRIKENLPAAAVLRGHRAPFGSATAAAVMGAGPLGSSRLGYSSAPGSPVGHRGPAWGATTPGKPPLGSTTPSRYPSTSATPNRDPRTPGTPWARPMDDFEVMESPAVREAMAGRPALQMSPARSMPSPGMGHLENLPCAENDGAHLKPRSVHDRASRAAALQPLSKTRAELLGVVVDPTGEAAEEEEQEDVPSPAAPGGSDARASGKPSALRSLRFHG